MVNLGYLNVYHNMAPTDIYEKALQMLLIVKISM